MDRYEIIFDDRFAEEGMHGTVRCLIETFGSYSVLDGNYVWTPPNDRAKEGLIDFDSDLFPGIKVRRLEEAA